MKHQVPVLLLSVCIIAVCGILYELLISSISSYFQGSSILHFSLVIGLFLSFMGLGSFLSRYFERNLLTWFIRFEILLSIVGGSSAILLYFAYSLTPYFYLFAFLLIAMLGTLIGLEIPILTRIVRRHESLKDAMAKVLSFDYLGSLIASVAFPLILLPWLGIMRTAFVIGLLNLAVAAFNIYLFRADLPKRHELATATLAVGLLLGAGFLYSLQITSFFESYLYRDPIMFTKQSLYQRIVLTQRNQDIRLFIDGNLQFSSRDEYRYHEALVHLAMSGARQHQQVLVLGGGDGLAIREILKYPDVQGIDLVDLDPEMTQLGLSHPVFLRLNEQAMLDPRVQVFNQDAFKFVEKSSDFYDVVIIDLPDPHSLSLGKLYSQSFFQLLAGRLSADGALVTQSTSPYFARDAFWCIHQTLETRFDTVVPYTVHVPAFGQWGFNLAFNKTPPNLRGQGLHFWQQRLFRQEDSLAYRFLNPDMLAGLFSFDPDMAEVPLDINRIDNQQLVQYYERNWNKWQ